MRRPRSIFDNMALIVRRPKFGSNQIALMAFVLSLLSSGFAVYQWWSSSRDEHIRASIELSEKYLEQRVDEELILKQIQSGVPGLDQMVKVRNQQGRKEYIAFLANRNLVNPDYLSQTVVCDIIHAKGTEVENFQQRHPNACLAGHPTEGDENEETEEKATPATNQPTTSAPPK